MYIQPNSELKILKGIKLDNSYNNTYYFGSVSEQTTHFGSKAKYNKTNMSFLRVSNNQIKVEIKVGSLYDCNYLMFRNPNTSNKWFYAFITNVEYISENISLITYELDHIQTWFWDCRLLMSFVEREHSSTDNIGDNLVYEGLDTGDYVYNRISPMNTIRQQVIVIATSAEYDFDTDSVKDLRGWVTSGLYSGITYQAFEYIQDPSTEPQNFANIASVQSVNTVIEKLTEAGKRDAIIGIFMMPLKYFTDQMGIKHIDNVIPSNTGSSLGGYTPKNNKLYTSPYNVLYLSNGSGEGKEFKYELFSEVQGKPPAFYNLNFRAITSMSLDPQVVLAPDGYKCEAGLFNFNERLSLQGYPQCAFNTDIYTAWVAQNKGSLGVSLLSSITASGMGLAMPNPRLGMVTGGVNSVAGYIGKARDVSVLPPETRGTQSSDAMFVAQEKDFVFYYAYLMPEYLKIIDDYFTMYGYACHKVKVPNISVRPHWNYVKTVDANIVGDIPANSLKVIKDRFNAGITFWKNKENVGDYSLDNSVQ